MSGLSEISLVTIPPKGLSSFSSGSLVDIDSKPPDVVSATEQVYSNLLDAVDRYSKTKASLLDILDGIEPIEPLKGSIKEATFREVLRFIPLADRLVQEGESKVLRLASLEPDSIEARTLREAVSCIVSRLDDLLLDGD